MSQIYIYNTHTHTHTINPRVLIFSPYSNFGTRLHIITKHTIWHKFPLGHKTMSPTWRTYKNWTQYVISYIYYHTLCSNWTRITYLYFFSYLEAKALKVVHVLPLARQRVTSLRDVCLCVFLYSYIIEVLLESKRLWW